MEYLSGLTVSPSHNGSFHLCDCRIEDLIRRPPIMATARDTIGAVYCRAGNLSPEVLRQLRRQPHRSDLFLDVSGRSLSQAILVLGIRSGRLNLDSVWAVFEDPFELD